MDTTGEAGSGRGSDGTEQLVREALVPIDGMDTASVTDFAERVGDAKVVVLGDATGGTSEFYRWRARLTRELLMHHGFGLVAVDADFVDTTRVDRHVRMLPRDAQPWRTYEPFPAWAWRNYETVDFLEWLRAHNVETRSPAHRVGFFGLDACGWTSAAVELTRALERLDPSLVEAVRSRLALTLPGSLEPSAPEGLRPRGLSAESVTAVVPRLQEAALQRLERAKNDHDRWVTAMDDARVKAGFEPVLRALAEGAMDAESARAQHLFESLLTLLGAGTSKLRAVVWAHNAQAGDASATELGGVSLGQLCRRQFKEKAYLVGFGTGHGSVLAARAWGEPPERTRLRPVPEGSLETRLHAAGVPAFALPLRGAEAGLREAFDRPMLQRSLGPVYRPGAEPLRAAFHARLASQFDEFIWFEETRALCPLAEQPPVEAVPDTWPFGV